jgi:hypothetical protein
VHRKRSGLTDCDVDGISLIRNNGDEVSRHNSELVSIEANVVPVVDANIDDAEQMRLAGCQCGLSIFASK